MLDVTLGKMAELSRDKVKINEFTDGDRQNLLDIFVNNHKTLIKMCDLMFPP